MGKNTPEPLAPPHSMRRFTPEEFKAYVVAEWSYEDANLEIRRLNLEKGYTPANAGFATPKQIATARDIWNQLSTPPDQRVDVSSMPYPDAFDLVGGLIQQRDEIRMMTKAVEHAA
jgi:hypothetical protein